MAANQWDSTLGKRQTVKCEKVRTTLLKIFWNAFVSSFYFLFAECAGFCPFFLLFLACLHDSREWNGVNIEHAGK